MKSPIAALLLLFLTILAVAEERDAQQIVRDAVDHWRGISSYSEMTMIIHRPDWERSMTMRAWTKGDEQSLVRLPAGPSQDGNEGCGANSGQQNPADNRGYRAVSEAFGESLCRPLHEEPDQYTDPIPEHERQAGDDSLHHRGPWKKTRSEREPEKHQTKNQARYRQRSDHDGNERRHGTRLVCHR